MLHEFLSFIILVNLINTNGHDPTGAVSFGGLRECYQSSDFSVITAYFYDLKQVIRFTHTTNKTCSQCWQCEDCLGPHEAAMSRKLMPLYASRAV